MDRPTQPLSLGALLPPINLPDVRGGAFDARAIEAGTPVLVAFICNHCPFVLHILDAFVALANDARRCGLAVVAVSSNDMTAHPEDGPTDMAALAHARGFEFPYLYDESQSVARAFNAVCTPEFYLFDASHRLAYHGQFDDSRPDVGHPRLPGYPVPRPEIPVTGNSLRAAMQAVCAGRAVPGPQWPGTGCSIKWKSHKT